MTGENRRFAVEVNGETAVALMACVTAEGWNSSTIMNRAVQMYAELSAIRRDGGEVYVRYNGSRELSSYRWE